MFLWPKGGENHGRDIHSNADLLHYCFRITMLAAFGGSGTDVQNMVLLRLFSNLRLDSSGVVGARARPPKFCTISVIGTVNGVLDKTDLTTLPTTS